MQLDTGHRHNNFDALRLAAAVMVVAGHAYVLSGREALEPLVRYTALGGLGELGVSIFFVISGFLVTASWRRLPDLSGFLAARVLRILPGLAVALVITAFVLGPLASALPARAYFGDAAPWIYVLRNLLLYPVSYELPGIFNANPFPDAVNGSLWTLRLEFTCYLLVPLLDRLRLDGRRSITVIAGLTLLGYWALLGLGPERAPAVALIAARNGFLFLAGAALYAWQAEPRLRHPATLPLAAVLLLATLPFEAVTPVLAPPLIAFIVVGVALRPVRGLSRFSRYGDLSYGVYIYAFPIQQLWMQFAGPERLGVAAFIGVTLACVAPLAFASWWLVERPALGLKAKVRRRLAGSAPIGPPPLGGAAADLPSR